jgi:cell division transport system ATP-binding protein
LLKLENVGLRYGHGPEILKDVNFRLDVGEFAFLTGPSGAGKSSLLRLLFLALKPSRGSIRLFGEDMALISRPRLPAIRRRIGVVFQEFRLLDHLTTYDNVALPLRVAGQSEQSYRADVTDLLSWVGLADQAHAYPPVLSGGEKQRAAIARAVIAKPELLLADEPTGNVDPALANRLLHLFVELNRLGTTVLIATHDVNLVQRARAPVYHLEQGHLRLT